MSGALVGAGPGRSRPFSVTDGMVLIVAVALGLAISRDGLTLIWEGVRSAPGGHFRTLVGVVSLGRFVNIVLLNFLAVLLPAFLVVRLRRPRGPLRALVRQPGFAACAAPFALLAVLVPFSLIAPTAWMTETDAVAFPVTLAMAAPLAWVVLVATRRWEAEPGWIDRLGRILGALWIVCLPAHLILIRLPV